MSEDLMQSASESVAIYRGIARALSDIPNLVGVFEGRVLGPVINAIDEGQHEAALRSCDRLLTGEPLPAATTCKLLLLKAVCFDSTEDREAELAVYAELIRRFDGDTAPEVQDMVANAELNQGATLGQAGELDGAVQAADAVIRPTCRARTT